MRADVDLVAVFTQPDRPAGRGRKLQASPVKIAAQAKGIPIHQPLSLRTDTAARETLAALAPDLLVVVAYGLLLPSAVLEMPSRGCVNVHASLLPRWRGAAPIQRSIMAGDRMTGVTIMGMEEGLDTGPVYLTKTLAIEATDTGGTLHDKLAPVGAQALIEALPGILDASTEPQPQDDEQATYASKLSKEAAQIDWSRPAIEIDRMVRAFDPWPVAQTRLGSDALRIWSTRPIQGETRALAGSVLGANREGIDVATGDGILRIIRLQPPGKRVMSAADFLNSRTMDGETLG